MQKNCLTADAYFYSKRTASVIDESMLPMSEKFADHGLVVNRLLTCRLLVLCNIVVPSEASRLIILVERSKGSRFLNECCKGLSLLPYCVHGNRGSVMFPTSLLTISMS